MVGIALKEISENRSSTGQVFRLHRFKLNIYASAIHEAEVRKSTDTWDFILIYQ